VHLFLIVSFEGKTDFDEKFMITATVAESRRKEKNDTHTMLVYGGDLISPSILSRTSVPPPKTCVRPQSLSLGSQIVCTRHRLSFNQGATSFLVLKKRKVGMLILNA
jgi:hypothetical protein